MEEVPENALKRHCLLRDTPKPQTGFSTFKQATKSPELEGSKTIPGSTLESLRPSVTADSSDRKGLGMPHCNSLGRGPGLGQGRVAFSMPYLFPFHTICAMENAWLMSLALARPLSHLLCKPWAGLICLSSGFANEEQG